MLLLPRGRSRLALDALRDAHNPWVTIWRAYLTDDEPTELAFYCGAREFES